MAFVFFGTLGAIVQVCGQASVSFGVFCPIIQLLAISGTLSLRMFDITLFGPLAIRLPLLGLVLAHLWTIVSQVVAYLHPAVGCLQKRFFSTSLPMWLTAMVLPIATF